MSFKGIKFGHSLTNSKTPPPKKPPRPKRKRGEPLAELSVNVPRGYQHRTNRTNKDSIGHIVNDTRRRPSNRDRINRFDLKPTMRSFVPSHDIFRDDSPASSTFVEIFIKLLVSDLIQRHYTMEGHSQLRRAYRRSEPAFSSPPQQSLVLLTARQIYNLRPPRNAFAKSNITV